MSVMYFFPKILVFNSTLSMLQQIKNIGYVYSK